MTQLAAAATAASTDRKKRESHPALDLPAATWVQFQSRSSRAIAALSSAIGDQRPVSLAAVSRAGGKQPRVRRGRPRHDRPGDRRPGGSFERLAEAARAAGMGILLDVVPNHMGINDPGNVWWLDVLENGEGSYFADFFDIEWHPAAAALAGQDPAAVSGRAVWPRAGKRRPASRLRRRAVATLLWPATISAGAADVADVLESAYDLRCAAG